MNDAPKYNPQAVQLLRSRRSVLARNLGEPAPDETVLRDILTMALRVPDHRKLEPWRLIAISGNARQKLGEKLAAWRTSDGETKPALLAVEKQRFMHAPLVLTLVFSPKDDGKTPEMEQLLSTGAVGHGLNLACAAHGFASQWVTDWPAYDTRVAKELGLKAHERIAGFFHIGTPKATPKERSRPDVEHKLSHYQPA